MANPEAKPTRRTKPSLQTIRPEPAAHSPQMARPGIAIATIIFLTVEAWFLVYSMIQLWPAQEAQIESAPAVVNPVSILAWRFEVSDEGRLFILVLFAGAFGGAVIAVRDLAVGLRDGKLPLRSIGWYIMRPLVASGLGLGFYLIIRGGFFSPQADVQQTSPFSFVGIAILVGLFTDQAVAKLGEIADAVFSRPEKS